MFIDPKKAVNRDNINRKSATALFSRIKILERSNVSQRFTFMFILFSSDSKVFL